MFTDCRVLDVITLYYYVFEFGAFAFQMLRLSGLAAQQLQEAHWAHHQDLTK